MAAIDKTYYETKEQYNVALAWAKEHWLESIVYDYQEWGWVLWNTSTPIDMYIWQHCNIKFIHDRLVEQYWQFWPCKWRILVKWIDDWDSMAEITETILDFPIYTTTYIDILKELTWEYYKDFIENFGEIRQSIKIISITNLYF